MFALLVISCNGRREVNNLRREIEKGSFNFKRLEEILSNKEELINRYDSRNLNDLALLISDHIYIEDTMRLNIVIEFYDKALDKKKNNRAAFINKLNILAKIKRWDDCLLTIDYWLNLNRASYYDYMLQGFVYEMLNNREASIYSFKKALQLFDKHWYHVKDDKDDIQKIAIIAFLYGEDQAVEMVDEIIANSNNKYAIQTKEYFLDGFERKKYIRENIFIETEIIDILQ